MTAMLLTALLAAGLAETPGRLRPPPGVTCPRDHLTSYTGRVYMYDRRPVELAFTIRTDWDSTERVRLVPPSGGRLTRYLLLRGGPFREDDWAQIERKMGVLKSGVRATAWVCDDGRPPVVDWQPAGVPREPE